jgi:hypothetical protein
VVPSEWRGKNGRRLAQFLKGTKQKDFPAGWRRL